MAKKGKKNGRGLRKFVKPFVRGFKKLNAARIKFKKRHPTIYKMGKEALYSSAAGAVGLGPEYEAARGAYNAYRDVKKHGWRSRYQSRNALYTAGNVAAAYEPWNKVGNAYNSGRYLGGRAVGIRS
jgi:hypothetical protein